MNPTSEVSGPNKKPFTAIAAVVFSVVSCLHLLRIIFQWKITFNEAVVPMWISAFGFLIPAILAVMLMKERNKS